MTKPQTIQNNAAAEKSKVLASDSPESELVGCPIQTCPDAVKAATPITDIDSADPPVLLFHGADDCTVPPGQSEIFDAALRKKGVSSTL